MPSEVLPGKICLICNESKDFNSFYKNLHGKYGLAPYCKTCCLLRQKRVKTKNNPISVDFKICTKCKLNKSSGEFDISRRMKSGLSSYCKACKLLHSRSTKSKEAKKSYTLKNRSKINMYLKSYNSKIENKLGHNLRVRLRLALKTGGIRGGSAVRDLGCTIPELKQHLEQQFKPGMSWENYGKYWSIDHIKPLKKFNLSDRKEFLNAAHWSNLQPLTVGENSSKGASYGH